MRLVKHDISFINPRWLLLITFLSFMFFDFVSRRIFSITFPESEKRLTSLQFCRSLLSFFKTGRHLLISILQELLSFTMTSWRYLSSLAVTSVSSLCTHGCSLSGPSIKKLMKQKENIWKLSLLIIRFFKIIFLHRLRICYTRSCSVSRLQDN